MKAYQKEVIQLLIETKALKFGEFTLKSGRRSPYFINTGCFSRGQAIAKLGIFYAKHLVDKGLSDVDHVFGPAYKGIPLAVTTAIALGNEFNKNINIIFDRKEAKDHGEKGSIVGGPVTDGQKLVVVDDVITAGTTVNEIVPMLNSLAKIEIAAIVVLVDRCEKGQGNLSAVEEIEKTHNIKISPIITVYEILEYLSSPESGEYQFSGETKQAMIDYLNQYAPK